LHLVKGCDIGFYSECWPREGFCADNYDLSDIKTMTVHRKACHGGRLVLIYKANLSDKITILKTSFDSVIWVKVDKSCFPDGNDIFIGFCYIPPEGAAFYHKYDCDLFASISLDIEQYSKLGSVALVGDLNSRVGTVSDVIDNDGLCKEVLDRLENCFEYSHEPYIKQRHSHDTHVNTHGRKLIQLCRTTGLRIMNGRSTSDETGSYTFQNSRGTSVIDYACMQYSALTLAKDLEVSDFTEFSDHAFITLTLCCNHVITTAQNCQCRYEEVITTQWCEDYTEAIRARVRNCSDDLYSCIRNGHDTNSAVSEFTGLLQDITDDYCAKTIKVKKCSCSGGAHNITVKRTNKVWFDQDCKRLYSNYKRDLRTFNKLKNNCNRVRLAESKRAYKTCEARAKRRFQRQEGNMLSNLKRVNPKQFYKLFKGKKRNHSTCPLSPNDFKVYFEKLMSNSDIPASEDIHATNDCVFDELDAPFTNEVILAEIRRIKRDRAPGYDNLVNELFISCSDILTPILVELFNKILDSGMYPAEWSTGIVIPIFKKGNKEDAGNYRPITLINHIGKLFTSVINSRLLAWSNENDVITDAQLGFKPGYGTTDALFIFHSIIAKYLANKQRLYCCFVDYQKAFDSINHDKLWRRMIKSGITGKLLSLLQSMYSCVRARVRLNHNLSDLYTCEKGLIQGEALSPFLFSLFVNDLETELLKHNAPSLELGEINLFILMYADDTIMLAETVDGLQSMLNALHCYTIESGLTVNTSKTQIIVFRTSWQLRENESWTYGGIKIDVVNSFKYLGLLLYYNGKFNVTQKQLADQGKKSVFLLMREIGQHNFNITTQLQLFDTYVGSVINYCCEMWGFHKAPDIERMHVGFLKRILGVKRSTVCAVVYRELARLPMQTFRKIRILKFWIKLLSSDNIIIQNVYKTLLNECDKPRCNNWLSNVRSLLCELGMQDVWLNQGPNNVSMCLSLCRQRLTDTLIQSVDSVINDSPKCILYKHLSVTWSMQCYLSKPGLLVSGRKAITKLRLSAHKLQIECGRYQGTDRADRKCEHCDSNDIEDEFHFVLTCPKYKELREQFIKPYYYRRPNMQKCIQLLNSTNQTALCNLGKYVCKATVLRDQP
jgi:hypothetical protein